MASGKNVAVAILAGVAVGALVGVLYAPAKGEETRKQLKKKYVKLRGKAQDAKDDLVNKLGDLRGNFEEAKETFKEDVREKLLSEIQKLEDKVAKA